MGFWDGFKDLNDGMNFNWRQFKRQHKKPERKDHPYFSMAVSDANAERKRNKKKRFIAAGGTTNSQVVVNIICDAIMYALQKKLRPHDVVIREANDYADLMQKLVNAISTSHNTDEAIKLLEAEKLRIANRSMEAQADVERATANKTIDDIIRRLQEGK